MVVPKKRAGFTLFELIIAMSILIFLLLVGITSWKGQISRAYDARRKGDLSKLKAVLEHYANDHDCYPPANMMTCDSTIFAHYDMPKVICNPEGHTAYWYEPVDPSNLCAGYRLYTHVVDPTDSDVAALGCNRPLGCGVANHPELNYGVSSGVNVIQ
jgi:type II secretory pathway pseudopilin PulG